MNDESYIVIYFIYIYMYTFVSRFETIGINESSGKSVASVQNLLWLTGLRSFSTSGAQRPTSWWSNRSDQSGIEWVMLTMLFDKHFLVIHIFRAISAKNILTYFIIFLRQSAKYHQVSIYIKQARCTLSFQPMTMCQACVKVIAICK